MTKEGVIIEEMIPIQYLGTFNMNLLLRTPYTCAHFLHSARSNLLTKAFGNQRPFQFSMLQGKYIILKELDCAMWLHSRYLQYLPRNITDRFDEFYKIYKTKS